MVFLRPYWFLALIPLAFLLGWLWRRRTGASIWSGLVDAHLLPHLLVTGSERSARWPLALLGGGWLILVVALAGPVWRQIPQPVFSLGQSSVVLLDLSPSLDAADVSPSRLARARFEVLDLLKASGEGQVALIAFGSEPFLVSPLSADANTIAAQVPLLATDLIPVPGARRTDLALEMARGMLERSGGGAAHLILVTDAVGEMAAALESVRRLAAQGHRLSVLAVGTAKGAPVPLAGGGFAQDAAGGIQVARLESDRLRELARAGNGRYLESSVGDADTQVLLRAAPSPEGAIEQTALLADRWREEGPWLILILLPLAALAFRRGWLVPALAVSLMLPSDPSLAFGWSDLWLRPDQRGARELASGRPELAAERFQDSAWRATASYRAGDFEQALASLDGLTGAEPDYNRGNALARLGRLGEAVAAYEQALEQSPDHADARHNLELVRKLLEQGQRQEQSGQDDQPDQSDAADAGRSGSSRQDPSAASQSGKPGEPGEPGAGEGQEAEPHGSGASAGADPAADGQSRPSEAGAPSDGSNVAKADEAAEPVRSEGARGTSQTRGPEAGDLGPDAWGSNSTAPGSTPVSGGAEDPVGPFQVAQEGEPTAPSPDESLSPEERARQQSMEALLRQVPDDPAGLLRQRFLLQHLRREGRLP